MRNDIPDAPLSEGKHEELNIRKKWLEQAVYLLLLVATAFYVREAHNLPNYGDAGYVGASGFPLLVSLLIGVSIVLLMIINILSKPKKESELTIGIRRPFQVMLAVMVMTTSVFLLEWTGLIVAIMFLAFLIMKVGGETRYSLLLTLPPLLSLGIYAVFVLLLGVYFD
ncbi:tripartite tricarboxylate transporter TctB family protein [Halomonas sp. HL-93]|uniref:tripartite tricarboxylate transporter TctB family protein n=1 Tax=Halomonas sp. HL-93 TaxID=1666906 RepID=UPI0006D9B5C4|nr:tripartite tricarboxylate transporter TctB family protein [Halomonas sp. HL-93]KPQ22641.1 MAG: Tripartite tricarboxylate transporter TctB family [Halomonas sp. HL-93]SBR45458.1 Tripartite tricarboxylate transporter TctB family protein [Halomonas sp. HL-93]